MIAARRDVGARWTSVRLRHLIDGCRNGIWGDEPDGGDDDVACARVADFDRTALVARSPLPTLRKVLRDQRLPRLLCPGDLLLEKSGGGEQTSVGAAVRWIGDEPAVCSNFVALVRPRGNVDSRWLTYVLAHLYSAGVNRRSIKQTTGIQNLDSDQYLSEYVLVPSEDEQRRLADFLDRETARIDALIEKKTRFIELLREKQQAAITQAVTRGLDHGVPLKDSGIPWLAEVPAHWRVVRVKHVADRIGSGKTPTGGAQVYRQEGVLFLRSQNVHDDGLRLDEVVYIAQEVDEEMANTRVLPGDVLLNITGASIGRTCRVPPKFPLANVNQHVCIIRCSGPRVGEWLGAFLPSSAAQSQIEALQTGAGREGLNFEQVGNIAVALPPRHEVAGILDEVKAYRDKTITLAAQVVRSIELLRERRAALITAAVTGQIEVRVEHPDEDLETA